MPSIVVEEVVKIVFPILCMPCQQLNLGYGVVLMPIIAASLNPATMGFVKITKLWVVKSIKYW
jgi:hypothetical protein